MLIAGLQRLSLVDFPGKIACTVFTGGCNLRCPYCHNSELLAHPPKAMEAQELYDFLEKRRDRLEGVCVSGGEPCLHGDLPNMLRQIRDLGFSVKLDTNGSYPDMLRRVLEEGLVDYVAVDIKNSPQLYAKTAGVDIYGTNALLDCLRQLMTGSVPYELRTTVVIPFHSLMSFLGMRGMLEPLVRETGAKVPRWYLQPFVDRETVAFSGMSEPSQSQLRAWGAALLPVAEQVQVRSM